MQIVPDTTLKVLQSVGRSSLTDKAIIRSTGQRVPDGRGGWMPSAPESVAVWARITDAQASGEALYAGKIDNIHTFVVLFEAGQEIAEDDTIILNGYEYGVASVLAPVSQEVQRRVLVTKGGKATLTEEEIVKREQL